MSSLPSCPPRPYIELCKQAINKYKAQYSAYIQREERIERLKEHMPRSIKFKCSISISSILQAENNPEVAVIEKRFNQSLITCQQALHQDIIKIAQLELAVSKRNIVSIKTDLISTCRNIMLKTIHEYEESKDSTLRQLENNPPSTYKFIFDHIDDEFNKARIETLTNKSIAIAKFEAKAKASETSQDFEMDIDRQPLVGNLITREIQSAVANLQKQIDSLQLKGLKGQSNRSGNTIGHAKPSQPPNKTRYQAPKNSRTQATKAKGKVEGSGKGKNANKSKGKKKNTKPNSSYVPYKRPRQC